jgi:serine/threonine protein kinase
MIWLLIFGQLVSFLMFCKYITNLQLICRLCGFPPFYGESQKELFENIMSGRYDFPDPEWTQVSEQGSVKGQKLRLTHSAKNFIKRMLVVDPEKRYTAEQALADEWILVFYPSISLE